MSNYYNSQADRLEPIPEAPYYVTARDNFMSGWGHARKFKNYVVIPCQSSEDVDKALDWLKGRDEMRYVDVKYSKPRNRADVLYSLCKPVY